DLRASSFSALPLPPNVNIRDSGFDANGDIVVLAEKFVDSSRRLDLFFWLPSHQAAQPGFGRIAFEAWRLSSHHWNRVEEWNSNVEWGADSVERLRIAADLQPRSSQRMQAAFDAKSWNEDEHRTQ